MLKNNKFFITAILTCFVSFLLVALLNVLIDPFAALNSAMTILPRKYQYKTVDGVRMTKAADVYHLRPKMIVLGTSRALCGINSQDISKLLGHDCYNLGITDANFEEIFAYFQHALFCQPELKHVVLSIDLFSFNQNHPGRITQSDKRKLGQPGWLRRHLPSLLLSGHATVNSLFAIYHALRQILTDPDSTDQRFIDINGYIPEPLTDSWMENFQSSRKVAADDHNKRKKNVEYFEEGILSGLFHSSQHYENFQLSSHALVLFSNMIAICKERNIELKVFISPCGVRYWQALCLKGLWDELSRLKMALVESMDIWDYSGITSLNQDDSARFLNFYETGHYRPCTGYRIFREIYGFDTPSIGTRLTQTNIVEHLDRLLETQLDWAFNHPQLVDDLNKLCCNERTTEKAIASNTKNITHRP